MPDKAKSKPKATKKPSKPTKAAAEKARKKVAKPAAQPVPTLSDLRAEMAAAWEDLQHQQRRLRAARTYDNELIRAEKVAAVLADVEAAQRRWQEAQKAFESQRRGSR